MTSPRGVAGLVALTSGVLLLALTVIGPLAPSNAAFVMPGMAAMPGMAGMAGMHGSGVALMADHMAQYPGAAGSASARIEGAPEVRIEARDFAFGTPQVELAAGAVNVTLRNTGAAPHDITVPELGLHLVAAPGETVTAGLRDVRPGRYPGYCGVPGHADLGMRITIVAR